MHGFFSERARGVETISKRLKSTPNVTVAAEKLHDILLMLSEAASDEKLCYSTTFYIKNIWECDQIFKPLSEAS